MTYLMPPLNALRAFEAAARHLSFKLAARELHVTPGAIGQRVKILEERLGVRFFQRLHKRLVLTTAGQAYLGSIRDAFTEIAAATMSITPPGVAVTLNVGVHGAFVWSRLYASLDVFRATDPRVGVRVTQPAGLRELEEGKLDLAIDRGVTQHPGYICERIGSYQDHTGAGFFLICPSGTTECAEIESFRSWILSRGTVVPMPMKAIMRRR